MRKKVLSESSADLRTRGKANKIMALKETHTRNTNRKEKQPIAPPLQPPTAFLTNPQVPDV